MPPAWEGSSFIITYPRSDFELQQYIDVWKTKENIKYILISSELHEDESLHRHAVLHFSKKQRVGQDFFNHNERHPNIKCVGRKRTDWSNVCAYVKKCGTFIEWGEPRHSACVWSAIATASTRQEAQEMLSVEKPRDAVLNARNFDYWLDKVFPMSEITSYSGRSSDQFVVPPPLQEWVLMSWWYVYINPPSPPKGGLLMSNISY